MGGVFGELEQRALSAFRLPLFKERIAESGERPVYVHISIGLPEPGATRRYAMCHVLCAMCYALCASKLRLHNCCNQLYSVNYIVVINHFTGSMDVAARNGHDTSGDTALG